MNRKEKYKLLLQDQRWIDKRNYIYKRDRYKCRNCGKSNTLLNVHHKVYISKSNTWEIDEKYLITLCKQCHDSIHATKKIKTISIDNKKNKKQKKIIKYKKIVNKWNKIYPV